MSDLAIDLVKRRVEAVKADIHTDIATLRTNRDLGTLIGNMAANLSNLADAVTATLTLLEASQSARPAPVIDLKGH